MTRITGLLVATALVVGATPVIAAPRGVHHRVHHVARDYHRAPNYAYRAGPAYLSTGPYGPNSVEYPAPSAADDPYNPYAAPGAAIRAMARRNQFAPGVTNELAPDNIATATGGPSGGVPGFSSH